MTTATIEKGIRAFCLATVLLVGTSIAHADSSQSGSAFTMAVFEDQAYGKNVMSGKYDRAINRLSTRQTQFESQTNLCVALAKSKNLGAAMAACQSAIIALQRQEQNYERRVRHGSVSADAFDSNLSIALSNQGVLLAIAGNYDEARENFATALELKQNVAAAQQNMRRLEQIAQ